MIAAVRRPTRYVFVPFRVIGDAFGARIVRGVRGIPKPSAGSDAPCACVGMSALYAPVSEAALQVAALAGDNRNVSAGDMTDSGKEVLVRTLGELTSVADVEKVLVKNDGGRPVYVRDVAKVSDAFQEFKSEQWVDGKPGAKLAAR